MVKNSDNIVTKNVSTIKDYIEMYEMYLKNSKTTPNHYEKMFYTDKIGELKRIGDFETGNLEPTNNGNIRGKFGFTYCDNKLKIGKCFIDAEQIYNGNGITTIWSEISNEKLIPETEEEVIALDVIRKTFEDVYEKEENVKAYIQ